MTETKMVDKVSKILNQAERAPEGSPEREAFMEKAMIMSQAWSIDLAVARAHQAKKEQHEKPERRTFTVGERGPRKAGKNAHFVDLMIAICDANGIQVVISGSNVYVFGTGMPSDLDVAERLFALLSVQMVVEADNLLKAGANCELQSVPKKVRVEIPEDERAWGQHDGSDSYGDSCYYDSKDDDVRDGLRYDWVKSYPPPKYRLEPVCDIDGWEIHEEKLVSTTDGRVWRANFYSGFVNRTRYRLQEARRRALQDAGIVLADESDSRSLALRDKEKEVREAFEENEKFVLSTGKTYDGAQVSRLSYDGQVAGDEAGKRARLGDEKDLGN